jgi:hypothetical protein
MEPDDDERDKRPDPERVQPIEDLGKLAVPKGQLGVREALVFTESVLMELKTVRLSPFELLHGLAVYFAPLTCDVLKAHYSNTFGNRLADAPAFCLACLYAQPNRTWTPLPDSCV